MSKIKINMLFILLFSCFLTAGLFLLLSPNNDQNKTSASNFNFKVITVLQTSATNYYQSSGTNRPAGNAIFSLQWFNNKSEAAGWGGQMMIDISQIL